MTNLAQGFAREWFVKAQSTFDTIAAFAAGDAFLAEKVDFQPFKNFEEIKEAAGTASLQGEIAENRGGKWNMKAYIRPGAVGVAPDIGPFLKAGYGTETIVGGTSVTYVLDDNAPTGIQLCEKTGDYLFQMASGAWVEQIEVEGQGNQAPMISASGGYARHVWVQGCTIASGSGTSVILTAVHAGNVSEGAIVKFGSEDNSGAGYTVTAVSADGVTLTVDPTLAGAVSNEDEVAPVLATGTTTGSPINGVQDSLTFDAIAMGPITSKYSIATGIHGLDKESTADRANRLARGPRRVTTAHQVYYLDRTTGPLAGMAWNGLERAIVHRMGPTTAAAKCTANVLKCKLGVTQISPPEAEETVFSINGKAHQSATAADEHTLVFD